MDSQPHGHEPTVSPQTLTVTTDVPAAEMCGLETGELLRRTRAGNRAALDQLIERLTPLAWNIARAQGLGKEAASGAVQGTWVALLNNMHLIESPEALTDRLITITRRNARAIRTTTRRVEPAEPRELTDEPDPTVTSFDNAIVSDHVNSLANNLISRERYRCLWENLQKLPRTCQEMLRILAFTAHTDQSAALNVLDMQHDGIGSACIRCLNELRTLLQNDPRWSAV